MAMIRHRISGLVRATPIRKKKFRDKDRKDKVEADRIAVGVQILEQEENEESGEETNHGNG